MNSVNLAPYFNQAVLQDSLIFVQGRFNSLNGVTTHNLTGIDVKNGQPTHLNPPLTSTTPPYPQPITNATHLFVNNGMIWMGLSSFNYYAIAGLQQYFPFLFGALDSATGAPLPGTVTFASKPNSPGGYLADPYPFAGVYDFRLDPDYCMVVGDFDFANGELHDNIVRLSYGTYTPPSMGALSITGPDTVRSNGNPVSYTLPAGMGYTWSFSGADATLTDSGLNSVLLSFGNNATSGVLSAKGVGYCGAATATIQKNIVVIRIPRAPTLNSCCMAFSNVQSDQLTLSFTPGNGNGRLVLASTSAATATPSQLKAYIANEQFGSGADLGGGQYAVYAGSSNTVTVTGLQPSTRYYFTVFEYNGSGDTLTYQIPAPSTGYASNTGYTSTLAVEPTLAPSNLRFSNIGPDALTISCTPGNGSGRIYLFQLAGPGLATPYDRETYLSDPRFKYGYQFWDNSYVVANAGTQVTVTNLNPATLYKVRIFEYSGAGDSINYQQNAYLSDTVRTASENPPGNPSDTPTVSPSVGPSDLQFDHITAHSVNITCTPGNGQSRLFVIRGPGVITISTPINGVTYVPDTVFGLGSNLGSNTYAVADSGTSVSVTGLDPASTYYAAIFETNGAGSKTIYFLYSYPLKSFTTAAETPTANWQDSAFVVTARPNPIEQELYIQVQSNESTTMVVDLFDLSGRKVKSYSFKISVGRSDLELPDLANLPKGIYILHWTTNSHKGQIRLYKK